MVKVLLALTSYNETFYSDGKKTGVFVVEALHPFEVFRKKGYEIQLASETGTFGWDDPDLISGPMTGSLILYSLVFMRYSMAVTPQNYLLFGCHFVNELAQLSQGFRWVKHHYDTSSNDGEDTKKITQN